LKILVIDVEQNDIELETKYLLFFSLAYLLVLNLSKSFFLLRLGIFEKFCKAIKLRTKCFFFLYSTQSKAHSYRLFLANNGILLFAFIF